MNIYIIVEIVSRELDSKLLLATIAAARGHKVILSDLESILKGTQRGVLAPGIFHTKSLTPSTDKLAIHKFFLKKGFKITSIDEEAGLDLSGYEQFSKTRFSDQTIGQASAVFGWGTEDVESLKKYYLSYASKIHKTGSPRVDLWKSIFNNYWEVPKSVPKKPFLLVSSNMAKANGILSLHETLKLKKKSGYLKRNPKMFKQDLNLAAEAYLKTEAYIEAIKYLADNNRYDVVLRPHPAESVEAWKFYLDGIPNVHVIREGSITPWVNNAFAVMHNGCTTALEATVSKKPLVTYVPFETSFDNHPPNKLGHRVKSLKELLSTVNAIFDSTKTTDQNDKEQISDVISKKVFLDDNELAAEKMVNLWDSLADNSLSRSSNSTMFQLLLRANKLRKMIGIVKRFLLGTLLENNKFPPLNEEDIKNRVDKFQNILGIKNLKCELLSDRTIQIKEK